MERFGGYTLETLLAEDARLLQLARLADRERKRLRDTEGGSERE